MLQRRVTIDVGGLVGVQHREQWPQGEEWPRGSGSGVTLRKRLRSGAAPRSCDLHTLTSGTLGALGPQALLAPSGAGPSWGLLEGAQSLPRGLPGAPRPEACSGKGLAPFTSPLARHSPGAAALPCPAMAAQSCWNTRSRTLPGLSTGGTLGAAVALGGGPIL